MTKVFQLLNSMNLKPHTFERFLKKKWNNVSLSRDILEECVTIRRTRYEKIWKRFII